MGDWACRLGSGRSIGDKDGQNSGSPLIRGSLQGSFKLGVCAGRCPCRGCSSPSILWLTPNTLVTAFVESILCTRCCAGLPSPLSSPFIQEETGAHIGPGDLYRRAVNLSPYLRSERTHFLSETSSDPTPLLTPARLGSHTVAPVALVIVNIRCVDTCSVFVLL